MQRSAVFLELAICSFPRGDHCLGRALFRSLWRPEEAVFQSLLHDFSLMECIEYM
jgi:hypothetical protein